MIAETAQDGRGQVGVLTAAIKAEHPDRLIANAHDWAWLSPAGRLLVADPASPLVHLAASTPRDQLDDVGMLFLQHHNAYVNTGLNNSLDREWALAGSGIAYIGVDSNTTAVTAATTYLHGAAGAAAANQIIKAISPAATRTGQTTTGGATFTNTDFTSGVFVLNKLGLLTTSTDAGTGLVDVIGGTGGTSPYARTFSLDLTAAGTFSLTAQIAVTAVAA